MRFLITLLAILVPMEFAHAEKRVALVIGNAKYKVISPLANPKNDAILIAATLKQVGFEVVTAIDVDFRGMRRAVRTFGRSLRRSGKDAVGLLYYAGHGVQARGSNYLIPLGADIQSAADLDIEALSVSNILSQMEEAGNQLNLVVLDACRNNPFSGRVRSGGRGLARIQAASGSLVAFAAAPGQVAADGEGRNSPYTTALADAIRQPGLAVEQVFKQVRVTVEGVTGGAQTPWEESSLRGDFYFRPRKQPATVQVPVIQADREIVFWNSVKDTNNAELLQTYVNRYPQGTFNELARTLIDHVEANSANTLRQEQAARKRAEELSRKFEEERLARVTAEQEQMKAEKLLKQQREKLAALTVTEETKTVETIKSPRELMALGRQFETGIGVIQDEAQAAQLYSQASSAGFVEAKFRLGLLHYRGSGVKQDFEQAASLILAAVKANFVPSVVALEKDTTLRSPEFVRAIQKHLKSIGHYQSSIDGRWGQRTRRAVLLHSGRTVRTPKPMSTTKSKVRPASKPKAKKTSGSESGECKYRKRACKLNPLWSGCFGNQGWVKRACRSN